jgi:hypothetical protein
LKRLSREYAVTLIEKTRVQNVEAIELIRDEGVEILTVDAPIKRTFFTVGRSAWQEGVGDLYPAELLDQVSSAVEEYRHNNGAAQQ